MSGDDALHYESRLKYDISLFERFLFKIEKYSGNFHKYRIFWFKKMLMFSLFVNLMCLNEV